MMQAHNSYPSESVVMHVSGQHTYSRVPLPQATQLPANAQANHRRQLQLVPHRQDVLQRLDRQTIPNLQVPHMHMHLHTAIARMVRFLAQMHPHRLCEFEDLWKHIAVFARLHQAPHQLCSGDGVPQRFIVLRTQNWSFQTRKLPASTGSEAMVTVSLAVARPSYVAKNSRPAVVPPLPVTPLSPFQRCQWNQVSHNSGTTVLKLI